MFSQDFSRPLKGGGGRALATPVREGQILGRWPFHYLAQENLAPSGHTGDPQPTSRFPTMELLPRSSSRSPEAPGQLVETFDHHLWDMKDLSQEPQLSENIGL
jgi:hypothetical protein